jgi:hypothetical protein
LKAVMGGANCFVVRGVHRSEAKTLYGLRSEGSGIALLDR